MTANSGFFSARILGRSILILAGILKHSLRSPTGGLIGIALLLLPASCWGQLASSGAITVTNAASFTGTTSVAPGEIITIFGTGIGPTSLTTLQLDSTGRVSTSLASTRVLFDGIPSPLIYASASQVSAIVPYALAGRTTTKVLVEYLGRASDPLALAVEDSVPGIFSVDSSGKGQGAILNEDFGVNSPTNPAIGGSIVSTYATGEGQTDPDGIDGNVTGTVLPKPRLPISVKIGGISANVLYAGAAPGAVAGVFQVNVKIPDSIQAGTAVPVLLTVGSFTSQPGITLTVSPPPVGLAGLTLSTNVAIGGTSVSGSVTLTGPAPSGDVVVTLSSRGTGAVVPATVTVPAGQISRTFPVTTSAVTSSQTVVFTATYAGVTKTATLTINVQAVALVSLSLSSSSVTAGTSLTGTVRLSGPAQTGGAVVALRTSGVAASVPSSVTVATGLSSATFTIRTSSVSASQAITITASLGSASQTSTLAVNPPIQASPWASGFYTLDGTLRVDGKTTRVEIISRPQSAFSSFNYLGTVQSQLDSTDILLGMFFEGATASGNTITYMRVDSASSNFVNTTRSFNVESIISGTMTLTLSAARAGAAVNGTINFMTTARTLTGTFTGTVLSID